MTTSIIKTSQAIFFAREVLSFCGITCSTQLSIEEIAMAMGVDGVLPQSMSGAEGRIITKHNLFLISYSDKISHPGKKRFVVAHELGHYLLHRDILLEQQVLVDTHASLRSNLEIEFEANTFAKELLLPKYLLKDSFLNTVPTIGEIEQISREKQVSLMFTVMRYKEIGRIPITIIFSSKGIVKWVSASPNCTLTFVPIGSTVPKNSLAGAINDGMRFKKKRAEGINPMVWFSNDYNIGNCTQYNFFEQCYRISSSDVLTMIWHE